MNPRFEDQLNKLNNILTENGINENNFFSMGEFKLSLTAIIKKVKTTKDSSINEIVEILRILDKIKEPDRVLFLKICRAEAWFRADFNKSKKNEVARLNVRIPKYIIKMLKTVSMDKNLKQVEAYERAIFSLLRRRASLQKKGQTIHYATAKTYGNELTVTFKKQLHTRIKRVAKKDNTSVRRLVETAINTFVGIVSHGKH